MRVYFNPINNHKNNFKTNLSPVLKPLAMDTFSFGRAQAPIYAIELDGKATKYPNLTVMQDNTGCPKNTVCDVISGRKKSLNGFVFIKASEIETKNEDGEIMLDKAKTNKLRERFLLAEKNYPIVLISQDCKVEIYKTVKEGCNDTKLPSSSFFRGLNNPKFGVGSRAIAKLSDVVLKDEDGNVVFNEDGSFVLDNEKLTKFYSAYFCKGKSIDAISFSGNPRKIYAFDYDGNIEEFDSRPQASKALGMTRSRVTDSIRKEEITHGYIFALADDIETINQEGERVLNCKKIQTLLQNYTKAVNMPVCTIDLNGKIKRYANLKDMQEKAGIPRDRGSDVLNRDNHFYESKGILIVRENEILCRDKFGKTKKDKDGNYIYDLDKVAKFMEGFTTGKIRPILARNLLTGEILTFKSATEASRYFSIPKQTLDDHLKSDNHILKDYRFEYYDKLKIEELLGV